MIFDLTDIKAHICFGSPVLNEWYEFDLNKEYPDKVYEVKLMNTEADPKLWDFINQ